jgi:signal recognition particle subunit SRP72
VEPLFAELDDFIKDADWEQALATSEKILKLVPDDADAFACQVGSLLQLGEFDKTLALLAKQGDGKYVFERAYCFYRLKRYPEALKLVESHPQPKPTRVLELEAQVRYALEDYNKCVALYEQLVNNSKEPSPELKTNYLAALSLANATDKSLSYISKHQEAVDKTFEFAYNAACSYIAVGDLGTAEKELRLSEKLCRETFSGEDFTEEDLNNEIAVVLVQLGFVYQQQGKNEDALNLYTAALKSKPSDDMVSAVASNNIVAMNKDKDLFDSEKRLKAATNDKVQLKLTSAQKQIIDFNQCLLLLYMNKSKQCTELVQSLRERFPDSPMLALILASLLFRTKKIKESEDLLKEEIQKHPDSDKNVKLLLSLAQIHLSKPQRDLGEVISILGSIPSLRHKPGVASLLVLLYEHLGDTASAVKVLDQCAASYANQKQLSEKQKREYVAVLKAAGEFKKKNGLHEQAANSYKTLLKLNRDDVDSLYNLVLMAAEVDPQQAEEYASRIPAIKADSSINAEALDNLPTPTLSAIKRKEEREGGPDAKAAKAVKATAGDKTKKKKKRKPRLPKNHDPASKPDPERWLPKKERSYYRPRRGAKESVRRGAQGSASASTRPLTGSSSTTPTTAAPAAGAQPQQQGKKQQQQGKQQQQRKKKGRR